MILETTRLRLRPFQTDDVAAVAAYSLHENFIRYQTFPPQTLESATAFVHGAAAQGLPDKNNGWNFAITLKSTSQLIGSISLCINEPAHHQAYVGYVLHHDYWSQGYTTEALQRLLAFGFEELALQRIWATADTRNIASCRVLEKAGLQREGVMRRHRLMRGEWRDSALYARVRAVAE